MKYQFDDDDLKSLALVVWKEARGEGKEGMDAVMHVVVNRIGHPGFARTLHDVIYGKNQFTSMSVSTDPEFNLQPTPDDRQWIFCTSAVQDFQNDPIDHTNGAHYYGDLKYVTSGWFFRNIVNNPTEHPQTAVIGRHTFYA